MKTRLDDIINNLDDCLQDDIKISSQIFGLAAASVQKNKKLLDKIKEITEDIDSKKLLSEDSNKISQSYLKNRYGSYQKTYQAYQDIYGIKCKRGWNNLLEKVQNLEPPKTLEERVVSLEKTVGILVEIISSFT